jgi:YegS/Rv2252/BmrU family lipid kinase
MSNHFANIQVIINPASGKDEPILNVLNQVFKHHDIDWEVRITHKSGDATRFAREAAASGVELVASYGGDGTQMEVASGLIGTDVPMAILPGGTGNSMAHDLNIPNKLKEAVELICQSRNLRAIDVVQVDDRYFILRANTGTDESQKASRESKDRFGNFAYVMEGARLLEQMPHARYKLTVDGQVIEEEGVSCIILNAGSIGQFIQLTSDIQLDDGLVDILIVYNKLKNLLAVGSYLVDFQNVSASLQHWKGRQISVHADPPQPLWLDGEPVGKTPVSMQVISRAVRVLVP